MTELLISVRNAEEAKLVADSRAVQIIDIKEPQHGSLGRASVQMLQHIAKKVDPSVCLSVALGELENLHSGNFCLDGQLWGRFQFAKIGLAGEASNPEWRTHWKQQLDFLPRSVGRVAVAYVDYHQCNAPSIWDVLEASQDLKCHAVLLDTFGKSQGCLFDYVSESELAAIMYEIRRLNVMSVVAGSIDLGCLAQAIQCKPDLIGVRGAVCRRGRADEIDKSLLLEFVNRLRSLRELNDKNLTS